MTLKKPSLDSILIGTFLTSWALAVIILAYDFGFQKTQISKAKVVSKSFAPDNQETHLGIAIGKNPSPVITNTGHPDIWEVVLYVESENEYVSVECSVDTFFKLSTDDEVKVQYKIGAVAQKTRNFKIIL